MLHSELRVHDRANAERFSAHESRRSFDAHHNVIWGGLSNQKHHLQNDVQIKRRFMCMGGLNADLVFDCVKRLRNKKMKFLNGHSCERNISYAS